MPNTKGVTTSPPVIKNLDLTGHGKLVKEIFLLDIQVQITRRGREQSSHHASILMDIFNVTLLMTAPKCPMEGWFVVRMVATVQPMWAQIPAIPSVAFGVMVVKSVLKCSVQL